MGPGGRFKSIVISPEARAALHTNGSRSHWFVLRMRPFLDAARRSCIHWEEPPYLPRDSAQLVLLYASQLTLAAGATLRFCVCSALFCAVTPLPALSALRNALSSLCNAALPPVHRRWGA